MKKVSGFTLIELMVTIALAAVLLTVGIPGVQEFIQNNNRTAAVNDLIASLQQTRSEAIKRNQTTVLCPSTDNATCSGGDWEDGWIGFVDEDENWTPDNAAAIFLVDAGPSGPTVGAAHTMLQYKANGRAETNAGNDQAEFIICDSRGLDESRMVLIFRSGRTQASDTDLDNATPTSCTP
ncbi:MAG: GspH/FimT family pseudopilin [Gammaproteobacteria bacterium]|nr:GspH/FimT family pseudopilin [Gammaproteobacteria bacterium]